MKTLTATFASRRFAQEAETALLDARFESVSIDVVVTPEEVLDAAPPGLLAGDISGVEASGAGGAMPLQPAKIVSPHLVETLQANATATLTVETGSREDLAREIIRRSGGVIADDLIQTASSLASDASSAEER